MPMRLPDRWCCRVNPGWLAFLRHDPLLVPGPAASVGLPSRRPVTVLCVSLRVAPGPGAELDPEAYGAVHEHVTAALHADDPADAP